MTIQTFKEFLGEIQRKEELKKLRENLTKEELQDLQESLDVR